MYTPTRRSNENNSIDLANYDHTTQDATELVIDDIDGNNSEDGAESKPDQLASSETVVEIPSLHRFRSEKSHTMSPMSNLAVNIFKTRLSSPIVQKGKTLKTF